MKKTKTEVTKTIAKLVVGTSVAFTVTNVLRANTPAPKTHHKVEAYIGAFVLGWMVSELAEEWTDRKVDEIVAWYHSAKAVITNELQNDEKTITLPPS